jgi:hypothetical protein
VWLRVAVTAAHHPSYTGRGSDDTSLPRHFGPESQCAIDYSGPLLQGNEKGGGILRGHAPPPPEGAWVSYYDKVMYVAFRTVKLEFYAHVVPRLHEHADVVGYWWAVG